MQGWRNGMEDSHILATNIDNTGISIFGVFDGHGGKYIFINCSINLSSILYIKNINYL